MAAPPAAWSPAEAASVPAAATPGGVELCPVCGEARPGPFARFCDTCRYDFLAKQPFAAAPTPPAPTPPVAPPGPVAANGRASVAGAVPPASRWDLHAAVDVSLRRAEDPMPADTRERVFPLDLADHLIGRRSDSADIHPEIVINDPGISRRHARILRAADGALSLLDLGSTNGTRLNGTEVEPNVPTRIGGGDEITLGCWTRLRVAPR